CQAESGFSTCLDQMHLTAKLIEHGSHTRNQAAAVGVHNLPCEGHCFGGLRQPLVSISQTPQCPRVTTTVNHPLAVLIQERRGVTLRKVCVRCGDCSHEKQGRPQQSVRRNE